MNSSAAPVLPQEEYRPSRPKKRAPEPRQEHRTRVGEKINPAVIVMVLVCITIAALCIGLLSINARKSEVKSEMRRVEALTDKINSSTERLEMELNATIDMEAVRETATTRLGMQPAAPHQIVTINVAKDSYSVQYDDKVAQTKNKNLLEKIVDLVRK